MVRSIKGMLQNSNSDITAVSYSGPKMQKIIEDMAYLGMHCFLLNQSDINSNMIEHDLQP